MLRYEELIPPLDAQVEGLLTRQITQEGRLDCGGFVSPLDGLAGSAGVSAAAALGYAYLLPESRHYGSEELVERLCLAAAFGRRNRRPSGCFDLLSTNFDSAPDTGFSVQTLAPVVKAARLDGRKGAALIGAELGELIQTAAPGMVAGGFHTPNHRWVLVSALALAGELFPELEVTEQIEAYLAEGIDINADGEFIERSTAVYNPICDRALRLAATVLNRPELLEPVRQNLELSYHLMHADATVVTSISSRQDRGSRTVPVGLADSYYWMARLEDNGFFAAVADWLVQQGGWGGTWTLHPFVAHPEWRDDTLVRSPLPINYCRSYAVSGMWRSRRGDESATAVAGLTAPFSLRYGQAELVALKLSSTYFATGQFVGEELAGDENGVQLRHLGRNRMYPEKEYKGGIYWLPIDQKVDADNWVKVRGQRKTFALPPLEVALEIERVEGGYDLTVKTSGGLDRVPFQVEFTLAPGGELETEGVLIEGKAGNSAFLKAGHAVYRVGEDVISFGPGEMRHRMWRMHNAEAAPECFRVLVALMTPVERKVEIRCGRWSWVEERIV